MLTGFQITPEGDVYVRNEGAIYKDTLANFALDFGRAAPSLPGDAIQMLYEPGKRCLYANADGVMGGELLPWKTGDAIISDCANLLEAQSIRSRSLGG